MRILLVSISILWVCLFKPTLANDVTITPRIIGGIAAKSNAWPWMTALIDTKSKRSNDFFCGGSLIAPNWVMTAAHCVQDKSIDSFELVINSTHLDSWAATHLTPNAVVIHPNFDNKQLTNDIALIQLTKSIKIKPIETLPENSIQDEAGHIATALGWGNTSTSAYIYPNTLQQVDLPIISNELCKQSMNGIIDSMLCAGTELGGKDTCDGDSGGPLIVFDTETLTWRLAGLTSFGESACAEKGFYGVYTRLDKFSDFISSTVCKASQIPETPVLNLEINGNLATARWTTSTLTTHYRLNYTDYPNDHGHATTSLEAEKLDHFSAELPSGSGYSVSITAYNGICKSQTSNVESFIIP